MNVNIYVACKCHKFVCTSVKGRMDESTWIRELKKLKIRLLFMAFTALSEFICMKVIQHKTDGECVCSELTNVYHFCSDLWRKPCGEKDCCQHDR